LMTPLLILLFGIHPATAVGTDLLYASATKAGGSLVHGIARNIEWPAVRRLAAGSVPTTMVTLAALSFMDLESQAASSLITLVLSGALLVTASALIFRSAIVSFHRRRFQMLGYPTYRDRNGDCWCHSRNAGGGFLSWRRSHGSHWPHHLISSVADGQDHRHGHCACSTANIHRGNRTLDDRHNRLAYLRFAAGRFVAWYYSRQLYGNSGSRNGPAAVVGWDAYRCCRQAPLRSRPTQFINAHSVHATRAELKAKLGALSGGRRPPSPDTPT
jgi:hypothetical protein